MRVSVLSGSVLGVPVVTLLEEADAALPSCRPGCSAASLTSMGPGASLALARGLWFKILGERKSGEGTGVGAGAEITVGFSGLVLGFQP